jgi:hypothetical protein
MIYKKNTPIQKSMTKGTRLKPITNYLLCSFKTLNYSSNGFSTVPDTGIWFTLNESKFNNWKLNHFHGTGNKYLTTPAPTPNPSRITMATISIPINEASTFLRSIKRSPSDYTKLKYNTRWKQWHWHLKTAANSHGIPQILDPAYFPLTDNARELYQDQQTFMYSLNNTCIRTKDDMSFRPLKQQQMHKVYTPVHCRHMKKTYLSHLQQQI